MRRALETVAWTLAFAVAYAQSPLYTSNQNQYFLHGLARAGVGYLRDDWLVHTAEPTPLFSAMVSAVATVSPSWVFYFVYAALMGVYLFSLLSIVSSVFGLSGPGKRTATLAALVVLHSAALRYLLGRLVLPEAEFLLEGGVAGQRLLGAVLQPSTFGVLLVLSVALFLRNRRIAAVLALGVAAAVHPTYLLSAAVLLATFAALTARRSSWREAAVMALVGAALLAPTAGWAFLAFRPSDPGRFAVAADILIRLRLPHHAIPAKWLDVTVAAQAALVAVAAVLARRSQVLIVLLVGAAFVVGSTALQMLSGDPTLALLFPWRLSTVVVPISTAIVAGAAVGALLDRIVDRPRWIAAVRWAALAAVVLAVAAGAFRFQTERRQQQEDPAAPMMAFVASTLAPGQVYFIDPKLQDFRLRTGAPIVVEAKAIPYRDQEVIAWFDRLKLARLFFRNQPVRLNCSSLETARERYGATHTVLGPEQYGLTCPQLEEIYRDGEYAVYRIHDVP